MNYWIVTWLILLVVNVYATFYGESPVFNAFASGIALSQLGTSIVNRRK
jgi:hypothetical protein